MAADREKMEEILSGREYQVYYDDSASLLERAIAWVEAWLAELLGRLFPAFSGSGGVSGFVFVLVILAIIALLIVIFVMVGKNAKRRHTFRDQKPLQVNELEWTYHEHLKEAERQEEFENYTAATRHLFLGLLLYFHEIKWLEARIWKTNWEYYEELKEVNKASAEFFYAFVLLFDQATYGKRKVTQEEYEYYLQEAKKWLKENEPMKEAP